MGLERRPEDAVATYTYLTWIAAGPQGDLCGLSLSRLKRLERHCVGGIRRRKEPLWKWMKRKTWISEWILETKWKLFMEVWSGMKDELEKDIIAMDQKIEEIERMEVGDEIDQSQYEKKQQEVERGLEEKHEAVLEAISIIEAMNEVERLRERVRKFRFAIQCETLLEKHFETIQQQEVSESTSQNGEDGVEPMPLRLGWHREESFSKELYHNQEVEAKMNPKNEEVFENQENQCHKQEVEKEVNPKNEDVLENRKNQEDQEVDQVNQEVGKKARRRRRRGKEVDQKQEVENEMDQKQASEEGLRLRALLNPEGAVTRERVSYAVDQVNQEVGKKARRRRRRGKEADHQQEVENEIAQEQELGEEIVVSREFYVSVNKRKGRQVSDGPRGALVIRIKKRHIETQTENSERDMSLNGAKQRGCSIATGAVFTKANNVSFETYRCPALVYGCPSVSSVTTLITFLTSRR
ncbi:hypothetical protein COOONC_04083 [Cooperia oncophora]